jgi:hypothetical protein
VKTMIDTDVLGLQVYSGRATSLQRLAEGNHGYHRYVRCGSIPRTSTMEARPLSSMSSIATTTTRALRWD